MFSSLHHQIPRRYHNQLRYDRLDTETQATVRATHEQTASSLRASASAPSPSPPPLSSGDGDADEPANARTNTDELKWLEHRWLSKHGRKSQLKEFREKTVLMRRWFESLDTDGSGEVGLNELEDPLVSVGLARSRDDVQKLIDQVDKDGTGEVTFSEFLHLMYPKKSKRTRKRAPLHEPKARAADAAKPSDPSPRDRTKADAVRPGSPLASPRAPSSSHSTLSTSARPSPRPTESASTPKMNPVVKLFEDLQSGKLGDLAIPFPVLITAYRRRMLLNAHMAEDPTARRLGASVLQALESSRRDVAAGLQSDLRRSESVAYATHAFLRRRSSVVVPPQPEPVVASGRKRSSLQLASDARTHQLPGLS